MATKMIGNQKSRTLRRSTQPTPPKRQANGDRLPIYARAQNNQNRITEGKNQLKQTAQFGSEILGQMDTTPKK